LALDKTLDANEAVVGDPIRAHVLQGDGDIPRGAHVYGRVSRIINFNDQIPLPKPEHPPPTAKPAMPGQHSGEVLIQIEFEQIEYRRSALAKSTDSASTTKCRGGLTGGDPDSWTVSH
jgi:hypothetical protein